MTTQNEDGTFSAFNFENLPCGAKGIDLGGQPFRPWLSASPALLKQMDASGYHGCSIPLIIDPPFALTSASKISGPNLPKPLPPPKRNRHWYEGAPRTATGVPWAFTEPTEAA